jgi:diguanylate cyclase (GGDEF)-like protein
VDRASPIAASRRDPLTGVGNRILLAERLDYEMLRHARHERPLAVIAIEADGDAPAIAEALCRALRAQDTVARVGARAFCVLAPETDRYAAARLTRRLESDLAGARIGCALFPHDARAPRELVARAAAGARAQAQDRRAA